MPHIALLHETDWSGWRQAARHLALANVEPDDVTWSVGGTGDELPEASGGFSLPRALVDLAALAIQAREKERFGLLYSLVWRAHGGEKVIDDTTDPDLVLARRLALSVRAEAHRMRTSLRFMPVEAADGRTRQAPRYLGWYAPLHFVLPANAQLIARRFPDLTWSIVTPDGAAHWGTWRNPQEGNTQEGNPQELRFGAGKRSIEDDATLRAWWDQFGADLLADATPGTSVPEAEALDERPRPPDLPPLGPVVVEGARDPVLARTAREAMNCERCPLYAPATQTVFGEGPRGAGVMFIGEQPGDQEDVIGRPFVGPAGQVMDRAMEEAGIDRRTVYVTNAVKHFKFTPRGKRRIHQNPDVSEIEVCNFWLDKEREAVRPKLLVILGGSAARAVMRRAVTISRERGRPITLPDGQMAFVTVHPSYLLRLPDEAAKRREYAAFVRDLRAVAELMAAM
ncbi:MAG TPA: UdgX family uracil-DNA binding protein [Rhodopila sp.]|uniref:UdgX family uracil-DNA binding protein n=1 Tax=Rhodopila sp. TaxID=2480087 RepID=UPI002C6F6D2A|nr:UdgX family uracil-DNA binding protein [Rhodopila sp.]HVY17848.1 UdgX family uracil-DNA binding protein [Rhodopila sp.]